MELFWDTLSSLKREVLGVSAALLLGVALGLARSALPASIKRNKLFTFLFEAIKFPPPIAWIPFVILAFGIGDLPAAIIVLIGAFAPVFTNTYEGAEAIPQILRDTAHSLGMRGWRYHFQVILPATLPDIMIGFRVGVGMGWMSVIAAEMISGQSGLGYAIQVHRLNLQYDQMALDMLAISIVGFLLFEGISVLERVLLPWQERKR